MYGTCACARVRAQEVKSLSYVHCTMLQKGLFLCPVVGRESKIKLLLKRTQDRMKFKITLHLDVISENAQISYNVLCAYVVHSALHKGHIIR